MITTGEGSHASWGPSFGLKSVDGKSGTVTIRDLVMPEGMPYN